jgi:hypothetical protein
MLLLTALILTLGCGNAGTVTYAQSGSRWAFGISVLADAIKIAEVLVVLWGARQLWLGRGERRVAEEAAASLARKAANYQAWQVVNTAQGRGKGAAGGAWMRCRTWCETVCRWRECVWTTPGSRGSGSGERA